MSAQNDAGFLRMFLLILGALLVFTVIIIIAANQIGGELGQKPGENVMEQAAINDRIKPVAQVAVGGAVEAAPAVAAAPRSGSEVYTAHCFACHGTGAAGAPKVGDKAAWSARAASGMDTLMDHAINGKGAMPPRGGSTASDEELRAAIDYMLKETGV